MFVNFSNHPSRQWGSKQIEEASKYGEIVDVAFPAVDPLMETEELKELCLKYVDIILSYNPDAVMCQGEFTLCHYVINTLIAKNVKCLAACSIRNVKEIQKSEGTVKIAEFEFVKFREYC